jgi:hypothetical protein
MVGIHDFNLHLRDRLIQFMVDYDSELRTSWSIEQKKINRKYGIQSQESQLNQVRRPVCPGFFLAPVWFVCVGVERAARYRAVRNDRGRTSTDESEVSRSDTHLLDLQYAASTDYCAIRRCHTKRTG